MPRERPVLADVQAAVLARISGLELGDGVPAVDVVALVRGDARASAEERLAVYASMYHARLVEALASQVPRLAKGLGADGFDALAADYFADVPSRHPSLRELARALPGWLRARRPERPALAALAALEWARADVFDAADEATLTLDAVRAVSPERFGELPLRLIAAHRLVDGTPQTEAQWDALGSEEDGVLADADPPPGSLPDGGATLLVWRQGMDVYHRAVDADERAALAVVAEGGRFGVLCDHLAAALGDEGAAARAFTYLSTWIADGLLAA